MSGRNKGFLRGAEVDIDPDLDALRRSLIDDDEGEETSDRLPTTRLVIQLTGRYFEEYESASASSSSSSSSSTVHNDSANRALELVRDYFRNPNLVQDPARSSYPDSLRMVLAAIEEGDQELSISILRYAIAYEIEKGSPFAARILLRMLMLGIATGRIKYYPLNNKHVGNLLVIFHQICRYDPCIESVRAAHRWCRMLFKKSGSYVDIDVMYAELVRDGGDEQRAQELYRFITETYGRDPTADDIIERFNRGQDLSTHDWSTGSTISTTTRQTSRQFTQHANRRMHQRLISEEDVAQALARGSKRISREGSSSRKRPSTIVQRRNYEGLTVVYAKGPSGKATVITAWRSQTDQLENYIRTYFRDGAERLEKVLEELTLSQDTLHRTFRDLAHCAPTFEFLAIVLKVAKDRGFQFD